MPHCKDEHFKLGHYPALSRDENFNYAAAAAAGTSFEEAQCEASADGIPAPARQWPVATVWVDCILYPEN